MSILGWLALVVLIFLGLANAVGVGTVGDVEEHLVDERGFSLYYFVNDAPGDEVSNCYGDCAEIWPPFYEGAITVPSNLEVSDFATMRRVDGKRQTAYKGWPLYLYSGDVRAGDISGHGINDLWFLVNLTDFPP